MIKLKKIKFVNYCGYKDVEIDFSDNGSEKNWIMLYGPNGIGKSAFLDGISLLASPWRLESRLDNTTFFRRLTFHPDYMPGFASYEDSKTNLYMEAVFSTEGEEKKVVLQNDWQVETCGVLTNELPPNIYSIVFNPEADNPINMQRFQIAEKYSENFLDFSQSVYGYNCELPKNSLVSEYSSVEEDYVSFYTDFIINKPNGVRVHYRSFSAGERKIATLISILFNQIFMNDNYERNILLLDNIAMHVYYTRHMKIIEKFDEFFPNNQIIATTHSPIIINGMDKKYLYNLEKYIK